MPAFRSGQLVRVPCEVQVGPFPDEYLVTIRIDADQILSGFVKTEFVRGRPGERGFLPGEVVEDTGDAVKVRIPGSFFTTTGVAALPSTWARSHLEGDAR